MKLMEKINSVEELIRKKELFSIVGNNLSFFSFLISSIFKFSNSNFLVILPDEKEATIFYSDILNFIDEKEVIFFPEYEKVEDEISEVNIERVKSIIEIIENKKSLIITYFPAILNKIPPFSNFKKIEVEKGENIRRDDFIDILVKFGYDKEEVVEIQGTFSTRGGIVDFYPPFSDFPLRVEFIGNRIHSIRKFNPSNQSSFEKIEKCSILPLSEFFVGERQESFISQVNGINFIIRGEKLIEKDGEIQDIIEKSNIVGEKLTFLRNKNIFYFNVFPAGDRFKISSQFIWNTYPGENINIFSQTESQNHRLKEILIKKNIDISNIEFLKGNLSYSFSIPEENITYISNDEIFARYKVKYTPFKKRNFQNITEWEEIKKGDYIVHYNEGIGKFVGMEKMEFDGEKKEFIVGEYDGGDKLYIPIEQIQFVNKYVGDKKPQLSKLGSKNWIKIREKVKNSIRDLASDLYTLYVERKKERGFNFVSNDKMENEFEESFIYKETEDQLKAIEEVKKDMESEKITDRLICGDSGYGKTEVAMRCAFKAVLSGKQVVVLVPTTVLCLQHYLTFSERFVDFPVIIEQLSRLVSEKKQKEIINKLKEGKIDIIIGTHRLLQQDVKFKDIGLLIIDEEQKFGVVHKEKRKTMFRKVDVLTLTATPIPRTLYMSLSGLKDISLIETPPEGRLSVITYAGIYNEGIVKQAIKKEMERGGQTFYLHNYVYDIEKVKEKIKKLVPESKVEVAHGKLKPEKLSEIMRSFSKGEIDVLVATSIVENGLDIPGANTLIVDDITRYGLSDLYQLRGRVGRYKWRAYAYFFIPKHIPLNENLRKRIDALQKLNSPGSGYKIALKDLEIRGARNILGKQQHGFIDMVGFNLYCRFWREVMGEIKGQEVKQPEEVEFPFILPDDFAPFPSFRFYIYKKLSEIKTEEEKIKFIEEIEDKFGYLPEKIKTLISKKNNINYSEIEI